MSLLETIAGAAAGGPVGALLQVGSKILDRVIPDPEAKAQAQAELAKLAQDGELAKMANAGQAGAGWRAGQDGQRHQAV